VLISQNRQTEREKVRNDIEYEVNVKAELEIRDLHNKVDKMEELLVDHLSKIHTNVDRIHTVTDTMKKVNNDDQQ
jgi:CRP/FNR family transcriptional regulator, cyclic AMP receptor protein